MKRRWLALVLPVLIGGFAAAQGPPPPKRLPNTLDGPDKPALSAADAARQRESTIKALKEDLRTFDPDLVTARQVEGHWLVLAGKELLKDFASDRAAAIDAARILKDLRVNQVGTIPGSNPPFEYWLADGKAARASNTRITVVPITSRTIRAEQVGGTWVVTDGAKGIYDFGSDGEGAKRAAVVFWKYGFNQLGVIGSPRPAMIYPLFDQRQANAEKVNPIPPPSPTGVYRDIARTSLLLPGNVYGGSKAPFDATKVKTVRAEKGEWVLMHGTDLLGRFGSNESIARAAMKAIQDAKPTEIVRVGDIGWPLFLNNGQPIHGEPLAVPKIALRADHLKVTKVRDSYWFFEDIRPVMDVGSKADAELLLAVIKYYDLKNVSVFGRPETGGLRLITMGR
jgi:hypothetical protein